MVNFRQFRVPVAGIVVDDSACSVDDLAPCGGVQVTVPSDEVWDTLVSRAVDSGWVGIEALSGIRGTVADIVRTNAAAYGQAVADTVMSVRTWDRSIDAQKTFPFADCAFAPTTSRFQETLDDGSHRFELLDVIFLLKQGDLTAPVHDTGLARALGIDAGRRATLAAVRQAVLR